MQIVVNCSFPLNFNLRVKVFMHSNKCPEKLAQKLVYSYDMEFIVHVTLYYL